MMKAFYAVVANALAASLTNTLVWFAVTFWVYLETQSVIVTSVMAGVYTTTVAVSGLFLGSLVDQYPKKRMMLVSSSCSFLFYVLAYILYVATPAARFADPSSVNLWTFIVLALFGAIVGNLRGIALSTLVTIMVPEARRDNANGLIGTVNGVAFLVASIMSGIMIGFLGIVWMLVSAIVLTLLVVVHLAFLSIPDRAEDVPRYDEARTDSIDIRGTIRAIHLVPGLFGLIFFHTFNNFLGGVFMSLMDAYGLLLVSVQVWGMLWGFLSLGFIVGGMIVAKYGLGRNPLRTMFVANIAMWTVCVFFTIQSSIILLTVGLFIWLCLVPAAEAAEQTILQKVVPPERQGRVFGFAQSVEQAASPITAFLIGPIAQWFFIPFMTTGQGMDAIGSWFGTGPDRGLALLFTVAGIIGLCVTLIAMRSYAYRALSSQYQTHTSGKRMMVGTATL